MFTAKQYRAKAAEYTELLKATSLPAEIREFRKLEQSYLTLAENEEWMADNGDMPTNENDLLRQESAVFLRVFEPKFNPNLDRAARIKIFKQTLARCTHNERILLLGIVHDRRIVGITRADVVACFSEQFFAPCPLPPAPSPPVTPVKAKTNRKVYEPFLPLRSIGIVQ
jgi:hypothetical protein